MKLNTDLLRNILLYVEENTDGYIDTGVEIDGYTKSEVIYHLRLLLDGNYISGEIAGLSEDKIRIRRLTLRGHEYLENWIGYT